jgi:CheY-like chemotaxis protein
MPQIEQDTSGYATGAPWAALVVDDDAGIRQSLRLCLETAGARVLGVATSGAALEALDRGHFDIVFLDLWLGADAGLELLPEMLARQPGVELRGGRFRAVLGAVGKEPASRLSCRPEPNRG